MAYTSKQWIALKDGLVHGNGELRPPLLVLCPSTIFKKDVVRVGVRPHKGKVWEKVYENFERQCRECDSFAIQCGQYAVRYCLDTTLVSCEEHEENRITNTKIVR